MDFASVLKVKTVLKGNGVEQVLFPSLCQVTVKVTPAFCQSWKPHKHPDLNIMKSDQDQKHPLLLLAAGNLHVKYKEKQYFLKKNTVNIKEGEFFWFFFFRNFYKE